MSGASTPHKLAVANRKIKELEAQVAALEAEVARLRGQLDGKPPVRDPASTVACRGELGPNRATRPVGFGRDVTA